MPVFTTEVYIKQYEVLKKLLAKYEKWDRDGFRLPTKTRKQLEVDTGLARDYTITRTGPQKTAVKCVHSGADPHVHDIDLSTTPFHHLVKIYHMGTPPIQSKMTNTTIGISRM
eukprot:scaffold10016_cov54-Attheya_sp.AAC.10